MLKEALSQTPRVLVVDEAQWLDTRTFEFIRELWDDEDTRLAVVLVGAETCYQKIKNRPALDSRILIWQRYKPLTPAEVLTVIPQYHPLWADVPTDEVLALMPTYHALWQNVAPDDLMWINDAACHGNFRQWAKITYLLQEEHGGPDMKGPGTAGSPHQPTPDGAAAPVPAYSRDLVRAILSRLDPTQRHTD